MTGKAWAPFSTMTGRCCASNDVSKAEGNAGTTAYTFTVTLLPAAASNVTVNCVSANGTATAPSDYTAVNIPLTFSPGQTSRDSCGGCIRYRFG